MPKGYHSGRFSWPNWPLVAAKGPIAVASRLHKYVDVIVAHWVFKPRMGLAGQTNEM